MQNKTLSRFSTAEAAAFLGCAPSTLKISRVTGVLLGATAPHYIKYRRKVVYDPMVLQRWIDQFGTRASTAR